jgi:hypothetical protein
MTAPPDKELRRLLREAAFGDVGESLAAWRLLEREVESMARELLAARKVVRAAKAWGDAATYVKQVSGERRIFDALDAYDKARKGKVT